MTKHLSALKPFIITCVFAGIVLSLLAPFGTIRFSFAGRLAFWIGLCFIGGLGAGSVSYFATKKNWQLSPLAMAFLQSLFASLFVATAMLVMNLKVFGTVNATQFFTMLFYIWVVSMTISTIGVLTSGNSANPDDKPKLPALLDRLPLKLRQADIYALSAEDHYVRVMTSNGDEMILMRLSDAIKEVSPVSGLSPHRSWWVAEQGVEKLSKENGKSVIILKSGQSVPVSRNGQKAVKGAGWR